MMMSDEPQLWNKNKLKKRQPTGKSNVQVITIDNKTIIHFNRKTYQ
jgi:hypothetical protein